MVCPPAGLGRELDLPVLIHSRDAAADTMQIMKEHAQGLKGVIHCYSYSMEMAKEYVKMGFYIGVGGVVTFKTEEGLRKQWKRYRWNPSFLRQIVHILRPSRLEANAITLCISSMWQRRLQG